MTEDVLCKDNAWDKAGGLRVFQCLIAAIAGHATDTEFVGALAVDQRIFARVCQGKVESADVAQVVLERADNFRAQAQIKGARLADFPVRLGKKGKNVAAVLAVQDTATADAEDNR